MDVLYDKETYHVDVISSTKGLFMVRHYSYVCHKGYSSVNACVQEAAACFVVNQSAKNGVVYIMSFAVPCRRTSFKCEIYRLVLRSQDCLDNQIEPRLCSLHFICSLCSVTISHHSTANQRCSKKCCSVCSKYLEHASQEVHGCFVQRPKSHGRNVFGRVFRELQDKTSMRGRRSLCCRRLFLVF